MESLVYKNQQDYYLAIRQRTKVIDSSAFIEFMLQMILNAINESAGKANEIDGISDGLMLTDIDNVTINLISKNSHITQTQMAVLLEKSLKTIELRMKRLKDHHVVQRV